MSFLLQFPFFSGGTKVKIVGGACTTSRKGKICMETSHSQDQRDIQEGSVGSDLVVWLRKQSLGCLYHGLGSSPPHLPCSLCRRYMQDNLGGRLFVTWDDDLFTLLGN